MNLLGRYQYFVTIFLHQPYFAVIQRHAACQISNRLLVCPLFKDLTDIKQEHDRTCGADISAQHRYGNCRSIQYRYFYLTLAQYLDTLPDILARLDRCKCKSNRIWQQKTLSIMNHCRGNKLFFVFLIHCPTGIGKYIIRYFHILVSKFL